LGDAEFTEFAVMLMTTFSVNVDGELLNCNTSSLEIAKASVSVEILASVISDEYYTWPLFLTTCSKHAQEEMLHCQL